MNGEWKLIEYWDGDIQMYEVAYWDGGFPNGDVDDWNYESLYTDNKIEAEEYLAEMKGEL